MSAMRVVAAMFPGQDEASAARETLRRQLNVTGEDVGVAPFAPLNRGEPDGVLLAGRFPDEAINHVTQIIESAGGEVVADVDEKWTGPRTSGVRPSPDLLERVRRNGRLRH